MAYSASGSNEQTKRNDFTSPRSGEVGRGSGRVGLPMRRLLDGRAN